MHDLDHVILFEADPRGHASEWLRHILRARNRRSPQERLTIAVAPQLAEGLADEGGPDVAWVGLSAVELRLCMSGPTWLRALAKWAVVRRLAAKAGAGRILLLGLDHLLLPLALGLGFNGRPVTGILFRPTAHYGELSGDGDAALGVAGKLKRWMFARALRNPDLGRVLSLDPYFEAYAKRKFLNGDRVVGLADPAPAETGTGEEGASTAFGHNEVNDDRRVSLLLFGEITERKGALQLLKAMMALPAPVLRALEVNIAGRVDPPLAARFYQLVRDLEWVSPDALVRIEDGWIHDDDLERLIRNCDAVLAPYQRFVGSSGVLIRAAGHGKCVICQDFGLLGRFVRAYRLGVAVDTTDPAVLSQALEDVVLGRVDISGREAGFGAFLAGRAPDLFGDRVLDAAHDVPVAGPKPAGRGSRMLRYVPAWKKWSQMVHRWSHNGPSGS